MSSPAYSDGNIIFDTDLNVIGSVISGDGVLSGWTPAAHSPANMSVDIALGVGYVGSSKKETSETTNVAISAAHGSLPRRDIIIWDTSEGALAAVDGTPEAVLPYGEDDFKNMKAPKPPDLPASDDILIAEIYVPSGTSAINAAKIWDKRFLLTQVREESQVPSLPASKVTSGQFGIARMPRAASGFLEGKGTGVNPAYSALEASDVGSGRFPLARMPAMALDKVMVGQGAGSDPVEEDKALVSGLIVMWHGTIANIPGGWVICDGNNSTPNLLDRFVLSVPTAATDPGGTGGATAKTTSGHTHSVALATLGAPYVSGAQVYCNDDNSALAASATDGITDIRPKYFQIAFIMKT